jgi:glycine cleavage system H protein
MAYPDDRKYTRDHEWVRLTGDLAEIGITDFAQEQLGDVVYVELPEAGAHVTSGQTFGSIESVKAVSELFAPVSGAVVEANASLTNHPEQVNADPHGTWMIKVRPANPREADALLSGSQYEALLT